ncbi:probable serine/threonine-protein kinase DDB_G0282963 [Lucilia cuprina]|uniref:probable serine/threonine-protein kinase DDB_G0282963 n=1 Tax=Lucilia cuprina TaxID=7375 RepID=UPI001F056C5B|nr:probable serine/threonine-protein kinase DDB_G0282963 [Lucilia cuprina]
MAETQDNQYTTINRKNLYNNDEEDDVNDVENMLNKQQQQQQDLETKENYNNYQSITSFGDETAVDDLLALANDDATAVETANLLLSEHQPNFVDFDEFNICLNNILNDDVDSQLQLSPSEVISNTLTTAEVDELFKVNIDIKDKSLNQMSTKTLNEKNVCSINSSSSSSSSSRSNSSNSSLQHYHHQHLRQHHHNNDEDDNLLNMVQFDDHMDFTFSSELESNSTNITSTNTSTATNHLTTSINNANYKVSAISSRHSLTLHGHNYAVDKNNVHHQIKFDNNNDDDDDLDLNMMVDPISIQSTCNSTATVSASLTTTANTSHMNTINDDDDDDDNETPQETALNNVIKRNSHSIVNIFQ